MPSYCATVTDRNNPSMSRTPAGSPILHSAGGLAAEQPDYFPRPFGLGNHLLRGNTEDQQAKSPESMTILLIEHLPERHLR